METWDFVYKVMLALALGAAVGIERETAAEPENQKAGQRPVRLWRKEAPKKSVKDRLAFGQKMGESVGGVRTFTLISLLGTVLGFLFQANYSLPVYIFITAFCLLIAISFAVSFIKYDAGGLTTEIAALFTFLLGLLVSIGVLELSTVISLAIIVLLVLSQKQSLKTWIANFARNEVLAIVGFAIVALVILPILPNRGYGLLDIPMLKKALDAYRIPTEILAQVEIINPFKTWFIVALVSGINLFGYFMMKLFGGGRGIFVGGLVGGFLSSTTVTHSLALQSRKVKSKAYSLKLSAAALAANASSFLEILILILPLNPTLFVKASLPMFGLILVTLGVGLVIDKKAILKDGKRDGALEEVFKEEPFSLGPAVKFALILTLIRTITKSAHLIFGNEGFYATSLLASLTGVDAIVVTISELSSTHITEATALMTLLGVNAVNLLGKVVFGLLKGERKFSIPFSLSIVASIIVSFLTLLVLI